MKKILQLTTLTLLLFLSGCSFLETAPENKAPVVEGPEYYPHLATDVEPIWRDLVTATDAEDGVIRIIDSMIDTSKVDLTLPGIYTVIYYVNDSDGKTTRFDLEVEVIDDREASIELIGEETITISLNETFIDPGVNATSRNGEVTEFIVTGEVDNTKIGDYELIYNPVNEIVSVTRTVTVIDDVAPTLHFDKGDIQFVQQNESPSEVLYTIVDNYDTGGFTVDIVGEIDSSVLGVQSLDYIVTDNSGNTSEPFTIHFTIIDTPFPFFTIRGHETMDHTYGTEYIEEGAWYIDKEGYVTDVTTTDTVDTYLLAEQQLHYSYEINGANYSETRTVTVVDNLGPTITLNGEETMNVLVGSEFVDPYIEITDNYSANENIVVTSTITNIDTSITGDYTIEYKATDEFNNTTTVTRTVLVRKQTPVIFKNFAETDYESHIDGTMVYIDYNYYLDVLDRHSTLSDIRLTLMDLDSLVEVFVYDDAQIEMFEDQKRIAFAVERLDINTQYELLIDYTYDIGDGLVTESNSLGYYEAKVNKENNFDLDVIIDGNKFVYQVITDGNAPFEVVEKHVAIPSDDFTYTLSDTEKVGMYTVAGGKTLELTIHLKTYNPSTDEIEMKQVFYTFNSPVQENRSLSVESIRTQNTNTREINDSSDTVTVTFNEPIGSLDIQFIKIDYIVFSVVDFESSTDFTITVPWNRFAQTGETERIKDVTVAYLEDDTLHEVTIPFNDYLVYRDTTESVYEVYTAGDFINMPSTGPIKIMNDIDFDGIDMSTLFSQYNQSFSGYLDGNGYTLSNITLDVDLEHYQDEYFLGLFGFSDGTIINLNLSNMNFNYTFPFANEGDNRVYTVGGLVGRNAGTVANISIDGTANFENFSSLSFGGVIAHNYGVAINLHTDIDLTVTDSLSINAGMVIGRISEGSLVSDLYAAGSIDIKEAQWTGIGGVIDALDCHDCEVNGLYSTTDIYVGTTEYNGSHIAGIVGSNQGEFSNGFFNGSLQTATNGRYGMFTADQQQHYYYEGDVWVEDHYTYSNVIVNGNHIIGDDYGADIENFIVVNDLIFTHFSDNNYNNINYEYIHLDPSEEDFIICIMEHLFEWNQDTIDFYLSD